MERIGFLSELVQYLETPWVRQGAGRKIAYAILLLAHASWLVANLHSQIRCSPMHPGLQRKSFLRSQKVEAESLVFGAERQKGAQISNYT
jgi:hypothetical protein